MVNQKIDLTKPRSKELSECKPNYAVHPGTILYNEMECLGMTNKDLAEKTNIDISIIEKLVKGKATIDDNIATQIAKVFHPPKSFWLNGQRIYEETIHRLEKEKQYKRKTNIITRFQNISTELNQFSIKNIFKSLSIPILRKAKN